MIWMLPTSVEKHTQITPGKYKGKMGGYSLTIIFDNGNESGPIKMDKGIRCINCDADVEVSDDGTVTAKV